MKFRKYLLINEALKIVKKLKDKLDDGDSEAYKYLNIGKIDGYTIKKSKHILDMRGNERRDKGVPESVIIDKIKEVSDKLSTKKNNVIVFTYEGKYNMIILTKNTKYKQIVIKTEILQNRDENTYKYRNSDKIIITEKREYMMLFFI